VSQQRDKEAFALIRNAIPKKRGMQSMPLRFESIAPYSGMDAMAPSDIPPRAR